VNKEAMRKMREMYPTPVHLQMHHLRWCADTGTPCDVLFYGRKPFINVTVDKDWARKAARAAADKDSKRFNELLTCIFFEENGASDYTTLITVNFDTVWMILPMNPEYVTDTRMAAADLTEGDKPAGPNCETIRQMIRETYHCASPEEEERYLRRWIAS
jgi:hypothetical protein